MNRTATSDERDELFALLADLDNKRFVEQLLADAWDNFHSKQSVFSSDESDEMLQRIMAPHRAEGNPVPAARHTPVVQRWLAVAASLAAVALLSIYFFTLTDAEDGPALTLAEAAAQAGIRPGGDRAKITLGDGRTLLLDEIGNGMIAEDAGVHIQKLAAGQISYEPATQNVETPIVHHTISIPRGGHYQLVLPDGSKVHLNAESTLKYPTRFSEHERVVELEGEAFFEVRKSETRPFKVASYGQVVEVLGTTFNVYAYHDSEIKTTLAEGSVRVSNNGGLSEMLEPGEFAVLTKDSNKFTVGKANLNAEFAWHNGYFLFDDERIKSIMERVARWYDVEVEYRGDLSEKRLGGIFQRSKSLAQLLESFRETGLIEFTIEERRVIVREK